jgi:Glycosyltransferases involved in cell wall biogenesis
VSFETVNGGQVMACFMKNFTSVHISVLLPVYNGSLYLREAVDSILGQSYPYFELIIIDDGSADDSASIIVSYSDPRIRFYQQKITALP